VSGPSTRYEAEPLAVADRVLIQEFPESSAAAHVETCGACQVEDLHATTLHGALRALTIALLHEHPVTLIPADVDYGVRLIVHPRLGECECGRWPEARGQ
jgi:hypothetical protein